MAVDIKESLGNSFVGTIGNLGGKIQGNFDIIIWALLITVLAVVLIRFASHRHLIKFFEISKDGYVQKSARYSYAIDKKTNIEYLRPMFGKKRKPWFPSEFWQKTKSFPFFGVVRVLNLLKINEYTYMILNHNIENLEVNTKNYTISDWVYLNKYIDFKKKQNKKDMSHIMGIAAPSVVILVSLGFLAFAILAQIKLNSDIADRIQETTQIIIEYSKNLIENKANGG